MSDTSTRLDIDPADGPPPAGGAAPEGTAPDTTSTNAPDTDATVQVAPAGSPSGSQDRSRRDAVSGSETPAPQGTAPWPAPSPRPFLAPSGITPTRQPPPAPATNGPSMPQAPTQQVPPLPQAPHQRAVPTFPGPRPPAPSETGPGPNGPYPPFPPPLSRPPRRMVPALVLALVCLLGGATAAGAIAGHASAVEPATTAAQSDPIAAAADAVTPSTVQIVGADGGSGSGVVLSPDGAILTNAHVVDGSPDRLRAVLSDGTVVALRLVGTAPRTDLAVVRAVDAPGLRPAQLGSSGALRRGESVIAIGEPLGLSGSVTRGVVSALGRPVPAGRRDEIIDMLQTDAALNPGNSGGPLVDAQGRVVGITSGSLVGDRTNPAEALGFAIPIDHARRIADELLATGHATLATLPITVTDGDTGARIVDGGAGLQPGDTVTRFGNRVIGTADDLRAAVQSSVPGSTAELTVVGADGTSRQVAVPLDATAA